MKQIREGLIEWLDRRYKIVGLLNMAKQKTVPVHRGTVFYYTGGVCLFLFLLQVATGILLMMYYRVGVDSSYESVKYITSKVEFGWLIRSLHSWAANLLVFFIFVHRASVFFMKAFRSPRELSWVTGCALLGVMMAFGFSGYLLPWNELAFFATKVGTDIIGELPVVGEWLMKLARGGEDVTGETLSRFFGLHVAILPAVTTSLILIHLLFVQIQGMSHSEWSKKPMPFFPNFVLRDAMLWLLILNVLCILAVFFPWELGRKADPLLPAPAGIKPEWYFLASYQILKIMPPRLLLVSGELWGILLFNVAGVLCLLVPFWEPLLSEKNRDRTLNILGCVVVIFVIGLTLWGHLS